jgi:hypothetical protein
MMSFWGITNAIATVFGDFSRIIDFVLLQVSINSQ